MNNLEIKCSMCSHIMWMRSVYCVCSAQGTHKDYGNRPFPTKDPEMQFCALGADAELQIDKTDGATICLQPFSFVQQQTSTHKSGHNVWGWCNFCDGTLRTNRKSIHLIPLHLRLASRLASQIKSKYETNMFVLRLQFAEETRKNLAIASLFIFTLKFKWKK